MNILNAQSLQGIWAALPTPWCEHFQLSASALEENIRRYEAQLVDGVYTTDSDGEFYAIEIDTFRILATMFGRAMEKTSMGVAMGVTWSHTEGIIERIKIALDVGINQVHVAFPYWMPLAKDDVPRFFEDLAKAAPQARWIHYRTPRGRIMLSGHEYEVFQQTYPEQFIGTKLVTTDIAEITMILAQAPKLAHFVTDYCAVPAKLAGAQGVYSYWVNTLPEWTLQTWDMCKRDRWQEAMRRQQKLVLWESDFIQRLRALGHNHATIGKARAALSSFLVDEGICRPPYYPINPTALEELKRDFLTFWSGEIDVASSGQ